MRGMGRHGPFKPPCEDVLEVLRISAEESIKLILKVCNLGCGKGRKIVEHIVRYSRVLLPVLYYIVVHG